MWSPLALLAAGLVSAGTITSRRVAAPSPIRGVNLGSLFIIEPWMASDEWTSMGCGGTNDEWGCVQSLGQAAADAAFKEHWQTWVTQDDIRRIASLGLNTVRVPVGFWICEDLVDEGEYYPRGGIQYLDKVAAWASDAGLAVIIDLHGAPGSQTANQQFTGHSVPTPGFYTSANYARATAFLSWMTERIHTNSAYSAVFSLQVLNEPVHTWEHPSKTASLNADFYPEALSNIRAKEATLNIPASSALQIQFMGEAWGSGDPTASLPSTVGVIFDDHRYLKWDTSVSATKDGYIAAACSDDRGGQDTTVGEWSIAIADSVENGPVFAVKDASKSQIDWYRKYWAAQVQAYEKSAGWIFWSWKCNWIGGVDDWRWCYESAVSAGAIPEDAGSASKYSPC